MSTIIIGDIAEGQQWWGVASFLKAQLLTTYKANGIMHSWKQVSKDVSILVRLESGLPRAYIYANVLHGAYVFGRDNLGQLGVGTVIPVEWEPYVQPWDIYPSVLQLPIPTSINKKVKDIAAGFEHTLIVTDEGDLYACGNNSYGQLGLSDTAYRTSFELVSTGFVAVAAGFAFSLALKNNGNLYAFGQYRFNASGLPNHDIGTSPVLIGSGFIKIAAGHRHGLAIANDTRLYSFGVNQQGQLGTGDHTNHYSPILIGEGFTDIACGDFHSFAIKEDGTLYGFGNNQEGQLGLGQFGYVDSAYNERLLPTKIGEDFAKVYAGDTISAAIDTEGDLYTCGTSDALGFGLSVPELASFTFVGSGFINAAPGGGITFAIKKDGTLYGCGHGGEGLLFSIADTYWPTLAKIDIGDYDYLSGPEPVLAVPKKADKVCLGAAHVIVLTRES